MSCVEFDERTDESIEEQRQYAVIVWDDPDKTAVLFSTCTKILQECVGLSHGDAKRLTLEIDAQDRAAVGIFDFEEAELIKDKITSMPRCSHGGRLRATLEKQ